METQVDKHAPPPPPPHTHTHTHTPGPCQAVVDVVGEGVHGAHGCLLLRGVPAGTVVLSQLGNDHLRFEIFKLKKEAMHETQGSNLELTLFLNGGVLPASQRGPGWHRSSQARDHHMHGVQI